MASLAAHLPLASGSTFLITPNVGMTVWTLVVFLISFFVLRKGVFPEIGEALDAPRSRNQGVDRRRRADPREADELLADYRERLTGSPGAGRRDRRAGAGRGRGGGAEARQEATIQGEQMIEQTRRDIEAESRRTIEEIVRRSRS